jgi:hypothetical protein
MSEEYYTGELEDVRLCHIENSDLAFLWGYVVEHKSDNYSKGDWFASSFIVNAQVCNDCYFFETNNSVYKVKSYFPLIVTAKSIDNIRRGCPPDIAIKTQDAKAIVYLMKQHRKERG